jgi:hypothetical protein
VRQMRDCFNAAQEAEPAGSMAVGLPYGENVLSLVRRLGSVDETVLIIRHSERPSFDKMPIETWDNVGLTERGVEAATIFGEALARQGGIRNMRAYGWGLKRCMDTADAIASGAMQGGCLIPDRGALTLGSPIADRRKYEVALGSGHWPEYVAKWLGGEAQDGALFPAKEYAAGTFREVFDRKLAESDGVSLIVTHDLQIFPLVATVFERPIAELDFLDGLVVKADPHAIRVGFGKGVRSKQRRELFTWADGVP